MPEAVIVSTARSPIGRAMKGSLVGMRPDDLAVQMVRAALDKVPALNPHQIDDLMMGCGLPGGESGFNIARVVAVALGYDFLPGTTVNRYCSSSLQTTRMAFHAIKAGEGDAFISAGVETVSRFAKGNSDSWPDTKNPLFDGAQERSAAAAAGADEWHDPRTDQKLPDIYIAMGQTAENVAIMTGISREEQDRWGVRSQNRAEEAIKNGFFEREITPVTLPDGTTVSTDDGPRPGTTYEKVSELKPAFRPNGTVTAGKCLSAQRRGRRGGDHQRHQGQGIRLDTAGAHCVHRGQRAVPGDHGLRADRGVQEGAGKSRDGDHRHRPGRDQRGLRGAGPGLGARAGHRRGQAQHLRWRDRPRSPVRYDGRAHHHHAVEQPADLRQDVRSGNHVCRWRPGHGDGDRALA